MDKAEIVFQKISMKIDNLPAKHDWDKSWKTLAAGAIAGAGSATVVAPLDLVKTRHKSSPKEYKNLGVRQTLAKIYKEEGKGVKGFRALWRGNKATVAKLGLAGAVSFGLFGAALNQLKNV